MLAAAAEVRERRAQRRHPVFAAPERLTTGPNQVWSWDTTRLKGPATWTWYHLYLLLDIFSRYVVGWLVAPRESAALAERLIATSCARQGILPRQLTVHADRGGAITSKPVALLLADRGVTKTHSRPHVSNDNPLSEAQFKTLKYRPAFPGRLAPSWTRAPTETCSSLGTTRRIATAASDCTRRTTCTTALPPRARPPVRPSSPPRTAGIPNASCATARSRPCCPPPRGPIPPTPRRIARVGGRRSVNSTTRYLNSVDRLR
ncbi:MAG: transposase family protein [Gemmatimonadaceae bacterium]|nr:transposase family protein [Gemmatimonadaceae bacterium]